MPDPNQHEQPAEGGSEIIDRELQKKSGSQQQKKKPDPSEKKDNKQDGD